MAEKALRRTILATPIGIVKVGQMAVTVRDAARFRSFGVIQVGHRDLPNSSRGNRNRAYIARRALSSGRGSAGNKTIRPDNVEQTNTITEA